ncbi:hypothetical protein SAMN05877753_10670 [Bacillus oleivorans]|uniref:Uncharacterized protein n=1 Tax=Bacillus oleivorans TaxID=1448271 RepID=A0A285CZT3_9BACI|nr:hypothetical protein [Bacillus oleivorans]SNX72453.1 hypothetical protein SAMN05877753_10670 [Bacillus oleivorans]
MNKKIDQEATEANLKINEILEDSELHEGRKNQNNDPNVTNGKLQKAFYHKDENPESDFPPTYIYNNTPAIKITGDDD